MRNILNYILFLISAISVHGQVTLKVLPDKRDMQSNDNLTLTVYLEIRGDEFSQQSNLRSPDFSKFDMIGTASKQNTFLDERTKSVINQTVYQFVIEPKQAGRIKVGSFLITANDKIYKTEPFDIYVTEGTKKATAKADIEDDMYLDLQIKKRSVYKDQPTIAVLKAYSKNYDNFRNLSDIKFPKNNDLNIHPISYKKADIEQNENSKMSSQVIGVFLITPSESGEIDVPSVSALIKNKTANSTLKSNRILLKVKKLPENRPQSFQNAIGDFKLNLNSPSEGYKIVGQPMDVTLTVSGEGNFRLMDLPKLSESADYSFFPPKIVFNTQSSENGSVGNVVLKYIVIPKTSGRIILKTDDFSYFKPEQKTYENLTADTLNIEAKTQEEISNTKSTLDKVNEYTSNVLSNVNTPKLISDQLKIPKTHEINYKIILGNLALLCGLVFFIFTYREKKRKKEKKKKKKDSKIENIQEAEERLKKEKPFDFETELSYMETLKNSKDFQGFFKAYENFQRDLEIFYERNYNVSFNKYLMQNKGAKIAEDFRNLKQEVSVEKFAPFNVEENINRLYIKLANLISEIKE